MLFRAALSSLFRFGAIQCFMHSLVLSALVRRNDRKNFELRARRQAIAEAPSSKKNAGYSTILRHRRHLGGLRKSPFRNIDSITVS